MPRARPAIQTDVNAVCDGGSVEYVDDSPEVCSRYVLHYLSISCPTPIPGRPHPPGGDLTLLLVPPLGQLTVVQFTDRFSVAAFLNNKIALILLAEGTTQGDPLAMAMYTISTLPLISRLTGLVKQCWYADDSTAGCKLSKLKQWWDLLSSVGPRYGYFPNATKTILIVKESVLTDARTIFGDCDIRLLLKDTVIWEV